MSVGLVTAVATVVSVAIFAIGELDDRVSADPTTTPPPKSTAPDAASGDLPIPVPPSAAPACKDRRNPASYLSGKLIVGINGRLPGWSKGELAPGGEVRDPRGFDVDMIKYIARRRGFEVSFRAVMPVDREEALSRCQVHLIAASYSMTDKRDAGFTSALNRVIPPVDFAGPYFHDQSGVLCASDKFSCGTGTPIPQERICVVKGTEAEANLPAARKADLNWDCLDWLRERGNDVVAYSTDKTILEAYEQSVGRVSTIVWTSTPDRPISEEFYGIGLPDNSPELCQALSQDIDDFLKSGWDEAFRDNLKGQSPAGRNPGGSQSRWCGRPS